jgi:hypothetical protein
MKTFSGKDFWPRSLPDGKAGAADQFGHVTLDEKVFLQGLGSMVSLPLTTGQASEASV